MDQIKIIKTSYSALDTFKQCPLKYKLQVIDKIKAPKSKEAVFGNTIHKALEFFHSQSPLSPTLDGFLNYLKEKWDATVFIDEQEDMIYFSEAIKMLKGYYEVFEKIKDKFTVLGTEIRFEVLLENPQNANEKCLLAGIVDRIDKTIDHRLEIIDYKTTKKLPAQQDVDNSLQMSLYCLGIINRWPQFIKNGIENIKLSLYYLKHQEKITTFRSKEQLDLTRGKIWNILYQIEKSDFPPLPSALCDWCGYKKICPMWKHLYREQISIDDERAKKVVDEYFQLKEQNSQNNKKLGELQEIIEAYLNKEKIERVFGENGYITRLTQTRYSYDWKKLSKADLEKIKQEKKFTILKASRKKVER
jgi:RecB family exonuclease